MVVYEGNLPRKENEVSLWTVAVGRLSMNPFLMKRQREAVEYIKTLDGFVGVNPVPGRGTLLLFDSKNNAKGGRNLLKAKGCAVGDNIVEVYVEKKYVPKKFGGDLPDDIK